MGKEKRKRVSVALWEARRGRGDQKERHSSGEGFMKSLARGMGGGVRETATETGTISQILDTYEEPKVILVVLPARLNPGPLRSC